MSKHMQMTDGYRASIKSQYIIEFSELLEKYLAGTTLPDGKISFIRNLPGIDKKAVVYYTADAWAKMIAVINGFETEVAWHGLVRKLEPEDNKQAYLVYDIAVYPQEVTGATVNTDQAAYEEWLDTFNDDEFDAIRMQGHSHVNMGVSPSAVDTGHKGRIISQLEGDMYYIFMIWNKRLQHHITIYDFGDNVAYDDGDVEVKLYGSESDLDTFMTNAKAMVKSKTYTYGGYTGKNDSKDTKPEKPKALPDAKNTKDKKESAEKPAKKNEADPKQKNEDAKSAEKPRTSFSSFWQNNMYDYDEDYDDPYSAFGYGRGGMYGY